MTSARADTVAVLGTGLIGTSIALAALRAGMTVAGWDSALDVAERAAARGGFRSAPTLQDAVKDAELVIVATPIAAVADVVASALEAAPRAVVSDAGSIKSRIVQEVIDRVEDEQVSRFVPGHPMGGGERSGPDHASASIVDGIVWVVTPTERSSPDALATVEQFVERIGGHPVQMTPERHDRLVAFVSHLPQVASSTLMGLAATEEADEPDMLLLAAGGFRDLTRLAASDARLWSEILLSNADEIVRAIDLYVARLSTLRERIAERDPEHVERSFGEAKDARLHLAAKPQVRAGVAVIQVQIADRPGALADLTAALARGEVNIEDLQIVHSPEGGRGTVHLTVAATTADEASSVLAATGFDPVRLA
jgi:prephenate dehydrogenase